MTPSRQPSNRTPYGGAGARRKLTPAKGAGSCRRHPDQPLEMSFGEWSCKKCDQEAEKKRKRGRW